MTKQMYWLADANGVYAQVEGAALRDEAVRVHGWTAADQPPADAQVHVVHDSGELLPARLPFGALESGAWAARGWRPGPPPEMAESIDQAAAAPADAAEKPSPAAAGGTTAKE